jgi:hypothetical protein
MVSVSGYPLVQHFITEVLDMQFADVRAMLQLPRPEIGITPACNFAITSTLCNLLSGMSTTIFIPRDFLGQLHVKKDKCGSGRAFRELVDQFFPYKPSATATFSSDLYEYCRNPLAHSIGLRTAASPIVYLTRVFNLGKDGVGWDDKELNDLERQDGSFAIQHAGIAINGPNWTVHCDSLYFDVIKLLRSLTLDTTQMQAAEHRFSQRVYNWRH